MTIEQQLNNALLLLGAKELECAILRQDLAALKAQVASLPTTPITTPTPGENG